MDPGREITQLDPVILFFDEMFRIEKEVEAEGFRWALVTSLTDGTAFMARFFNVGYEDYARPLLEKLKGTRFIELPVHYAVYNVQGYKKFVLFFETIYYHARVTPLAVVFKLNPRLFSKMAADITKACQYLRRRGFLPLALKSSNSGWLNSVVRIGSSFMLAWSDFFVRETPIPGADYTDPAGKLHTSPHGVGKRDLVTLLVSQLCDCYTDYIHAILNRSTDLISIQQLLNYERPVLDTPALGEAIQRSSLTYVLLALWFHTPVPLDYKSLAHTLAVHSRNRLSEVSILRPGERTYTYEAQLKSGEHCILSLSKHSHEVDFYKEAVRAPFLWNISQPALRHTSVQLEDMMSVAILKAGRSASLQSLYHAEIHIESLLLYAMNAMNTLHEIKLAHLSLSEDTIRVVLDAAGNIERVFLCDFRKSSQAEYEPASYFQVDYYSPPEVTLGTPVHTLKADIWMLAVSFMGLIERKLHIPRPAFLMDPGIPENDMRFQITHYISLLQTSNTTLAALYTQMLNYTPEERSSAGQ